MKIKISLFYLLLLLSFSASWMALGGSFCFGEDISKPAELPVLNLPQVQTKGGTLNLGDFSGGLNLKAFPTQLKDNEAQMLVNAWWDKYGALGRRKGWTHLASPDSVGSANSIMGLFRYYKENGNRYLILCSDTAFYYQVNDTGSFTQFGGNSVVGNLDFNFSTYKNNLICVHPQFKPLIFSGTTTTDSLGYKVDSCVITKGTSGACTVDVDIRPGTDNWTTDNYVGYTICDTGLNCTFISENTGSSFTVYDQWITLHFDIPYYIYGLFYDDLTNLTTGTLDSVYNATSCTKYLYDFGAGWTKDSLEKKFYVIQMTSGKSKDRIFYVQQNDTNYIYIASVSNDTINAGDNYKLYQKAFYRSKYISIFKNSIVLGCDYTSDNIIYYSTPTYYKNFPPDHFFTTYTPDGDVISGLMTLYNDQMGQRSSPEDRLLIFKKNNILATDNNWIPYVVATGVGAVAPRSIVNVEGLFVGFAHTTGFYATDGNKITLLSEKIKPFWDNINKLNMKKIACGYYDRHIWCSVPYGSSTENDTGLIYNIDNQGWSTANIKASVFANQLGIDDTVKFIWGSSDTGWICRYGVSNFDNGSDSITLTYKSKEFDLGDLSQRKTFKNLLISYDLTSGITTTLNFYKDFGASTTWTTTLTDSGKDIKRVNISPALVGKTLSWGLSSKDPAITIGNVNINFQLVGGY